MKAVYQSCRPTIPGLLADDPVTRLVIRVRMLAPDRPSGPLRQAAYPCPRSVTDAPGGSRSVVLRHGLR